MKGFLLPVSGMLLMLVSSGVSGQEVSIRRGVVTGMEPVQGTENAQAASTSSSKRRLGGLLGRAVGRVVGTNSRHYYDAVNTGESLGEELADAGSGGDNGNAPSSMVMIRFDDGDEAGIVSANAKLSGVRVGRRVKVVGSGSSAMIIAN